MTPRKDIEHIIRAARRQGWRAEKTKNGHWKLYAPVGPGMVVAAGTPSTRRSVEDTVARLRRYGFVWKGR